MLCFLAVETVSVPKKPGVWLELLRGNAGCRDESFDGKRHEDAFPDASDSSKLSTGGNIMELHGKMIRIRPLVKSDLTKMMPWNQDDELQYFVDCNLPDNLIELERWFQKNVSHRNYQIFAIETLDGHLIGDLELDHISRYNQEGEVRIRIGEKSCWGKGYGTEALQLSLAYWFDKEKFKRIYLRVYYFNQRAIRCYLKNGFKQVGILRRNRQGWKDIILMEVDAIGFQRALNRRLAG